jgi:hypothetical protein
LEYLPFAFDAGGNLTENREQELKLFTNNEVLVVNQYITDPRQLYRNQHAMVWFSHVKGSKDLYVALFNLDDKQQDVSVDFASLGLKGKIAVRDLWAKKGAGVFRRKYQGEINVHGAALLRLSNQIN